MHADTQHAALDFAAQVSRFYATLIAFAPAPGPPTQNPQSEPSLGGKLLYAAELDQQGRALVVAANIAGVASLTATADQSAQKQAVRDGVVDFLVNSLDEALRILKNEIRKHESVAVCVAAPPEAIQREMLERGVLPDLLPPGAASNSSNIEAFLKQGAHRVACDIAHEEKVLVTWQVSAAPAHWLPQIDAIALECLSADDLATRRWLRLSPRYLGRLAQGLHVARMTPKAAQVFTSRVEEGMRSRTIQVEVKIHSYRAAPLTC
jgi:hypothetical protein